MELGGAPRLMLLFCSQDFGFRGQKMDPLLVTQRDGVGSSLASAAFPRPGCLRWASPLRSPLYPE